MTQRIAIIILAAAFGLGSMAAVLTTSARQAGTPPTGFLPSAPLLALAKGDKDNDRDDFAKPKKHGRAFHGTISVMNGSQLTLLLPNGSTITGIQNAVFPGLFVGETVNTRGFFDANGVFHITSVEGIPGQGPPPRKHRKRAFNGTITSIVGNQLTLRMNNGTTVTGTENAFVPGLTVGEFVQAKGFVDQNGVFQITRVKIHR